jgi:hypothetical protein
LNRLQECAIKPTKLVCELNGDNSQKTGTKHNNGKETALSGVEFKLDNPDAGHDAQHNAWMADKIADGWV